MRSPVTSYVPVAAAGLVVVVLLLTGVVGFEALVAGLAVDALVLTLLTRTGGTAARATAVLAAAGTALVAVLLLGVVGDGGRAVGAGLVAALFVTGVVGAAVASRGDGAGPPVSAAWRIAVVWAGLAASRWLAAVEVQVAAYDDASPGTLGVAGAVGSGLVDVSVSLGLATATVVGLVLVAVRLVDELLLAAYRRTLAPVAEQSGRHRGVDEHEVG